MHHQVRGRTAEIGEELFGFTPGQTAVLGYALEYGEILEITVALGANVAKDGAVIQFDGVGLAGEKGLVAVGDVVDTGKIGHSAVVGVYEIRLDAINTRTEFIGGTKGTTDPQNIAVF